jgi:hypothetical protein
MSPRDAPRTRVGDPRNKWSDRLFNGCRERSVAGAHGSRRPPPPRDRPTLRPEIREFR